LPITERISKSVLCLPFYYDLAEKDIHRICELIFESLKKS
jgi:dTDP-4-amino-4,6-dideoxygalactose transaminase